MWVLTVRVDDGRESTISVASLPTRALPLLASLPVTNGAQRWKPKLSAALSSCIAEGIATLARHSLQACIEQYA